LGALQTHTSQIIHVSEISILNAIYYYYKVSNKRRILHILAP